MRLPLRSPAAALGALLAAAGCTQDCKSMRQGDSAFAGLLCGGEGADAPAPALPPLSACQPRQVMPIFFSLLDRKEPALTGLHDALADLGRPVCLDPRAQTCQSDDQCETGSCQIGLCPCRMARSPLTDLLGISLRALAAIAGDPVEAKGLPPPGCLSAEQAKDLSPDKRSRICELRRMLDLFLDAGRSASPAGDASVRKVVLSLLDYLQGKTDGRSHYDLFAPIGRMAGSPTAWCDPAAPWNLLDAALGYRTPETAAGQLGALQVLLADPYTREFFATFSGKPGPEARDAVIVLANALLPAVTSAPNGRAALDQLNSQLLAPFVYDSRSAPQSFKDEVRAVLGVAPGAKACPPAGAPSLGGLCAMLSAQSGVFPPLQRLVACAGSPEIRCAPGAPCTSHDNQLVSALYDVLSRPEARGGVDLATLVGALQSVAALDRSGQGARTLRWIVQGIRGSPDPNDPHEARDALAGLAAAVLTPEEGQKLVPALAVLVEKQVLGEFARLLHDLLYTCSPPAQR